MSTRRVGGSAGSDWSGVRAPGQHRSRHRPEHRSPPAGTPRARRPRTARRAARRPMTAQGTLTLMPRTLMLALEPAAVVARQSCCMSAGVDAHTATLAPALLELSFSARVESNEYRRWRSPPRARAAGAAVGAVRLHLDPGVDADEGADVAGTVVAARADRSRIVDVGGDTGGPHRAHGRLDQAGGPPPDGPAPASTPPCTVAGPCAWTLLVACPVSAATDETVTEAGEADDVALRRRCRRACPMAASGPLAGGVARRRALAIRLSQDG